MHQTGVFFLDLGFGSGNPSHWNFLCVKKLSFGAFVGKIELAVDDDLNVSAGLAALFELVRELNRRIAERSLSTADAARALGTLRDLDRVLAILPDEVADLPAGAADLLSQRETARAGKDWATADRLRDELAALGVAVEDTRDGQRWKRSEVV